MPSAMMGFDLLVASLWIGRVVVCGGIEHGSKRSSNGRFGRKRLGKWDRARLDVPAETPLVQAGFLSEGGVEAGRVGRVIAARMEEALGCRHHRLC